MISLQSGPMTASASLRSQRPTDPKTLQGIQRFQLVSNASQPILSSGGTTVTAPLLPSLASSATTQQNIVTLSASSLSQSGNAQRVSFIFITLQRLSRLTNMAVI